VKFFKGKPQRTFFWVGFGVVVLALVVTIVSIYVMDESSPESINAEVGTEVFSHQKGEIEASKNLMTVTDSFRGVKDNEILVNDSGIQKKLYLTKKTRIEKGISADTGDISEIKDGQSITLLYSADNNEVVSLWYGATSASPSALEPNNAVASADEKNVLGATSTTIVRDSTPWQNKVRMIPLRHYPIASLPLRSEGCSASGTTWYKSVPWLGETLSFMGVTLRSGNDMYESGDCADRYKDGGSYSGGRPWLEPHLYGGWASVGIMGVTASDPIVGWVSQATVIRDWYSGTGCIYADSSGTSFCTSHFYDTPLIWPKNAKEKGDNAGPEDGTEADGTPRNGLFRRNGYSAYVANPYILMSTGTGLFRNEFTLSQAEFDRVGTVTLNAKADDFMMVYVNGIQVASRYISPGTLSITLPKYYFQAGNNVVAFQVNDKSRWGHRDALMSNRTTNSNAVGLWYRLEIGLVATHDLSVTKSGTGTGTVTSTNNTGGYNISCGAACQSTYNQDTLVTLTATPSATSNFTAWSGATCSTSTATQITLTMNQARWCNAAFTLKTHALTVTKAGTGAGTVTSTNTGGALNINCGATCQRTYNHGTSVTLTATPDAISNFTGWSGASCSTSTATPLTLTMDQARGCTATFNLKTYTLGVTKIGPGTGTVTSTNDKGATNINCGTACQRTFTIGTLVTLTASPSALSYFVGWSGSTCSTSTGPQITLTMNESRNCGATFGLKKPTCTLTASPPTRSTGTTSTLTWTTVNADRVKANWTPSTATSGSMSVAPSATTTYSMTAHNSTLASEPCTATVTFKPTLYVSINPAGAGKVTGTGINCGDGTTNDCAEAYNANTSVTITAAQTKPGIPFTHWSGACTGTSASGILNMGSTNKYCTANFGTPPLFSSPSPLSNSTLALAIDRNRTVNLAITLTAQNAGEKVAYEIRYRKDGEEGWRVSPICTMNSAYQSSPLRRADCTTPALEEGKWWWYAIGYGDMTKDNSGNPFPVFSSQYSFNLTRPDPTANLLINGSKTPPATDQETATYRCAYTNATNVKIKKGTATLATHSIASPFSPGEVSGTISIEEMGPVDYICEASNLSRTATDRVGLTRIGLGCEVIPQTGVVPLTVQATALPQGFAATSYNFDFGDGAPAINSTGPVQYHTFKVADDYMVKINTTFGGMTVSCDVNIKAKEPTDGSGGESN
jgi:hypothetical protein